MRTRTLKRLGTLLLALTLVLAAFGAPAASTVYATPPVYVVNRTDDVIAANGCLGVPGDCSLRGAVKDANNNSGSTIVLAAQQTYQLTDVSSGELILTATTAITTSLGVCSNNCSAVIAGGSGWPYRLLEVKPGATVTVDNVEFTNGHDSNGGALMNSGTLTLTASQVFSNTSLGWGGGILNYGMLALSNTVVNGNTAGTTGGAIADQSNAALAGTMTITNSTIVTNSVTGQAYGAGITSLDNISGTIHPAITMANSSILSNTGTAGGLGGGLFVNGNNHLTNVTLQGNANGGGAGAYVNGGQFTMQGGSVLSNTGVFTNGGGGLYLTGGVTLTSVTTLTNVTVAGNIAGGGGGIVLTFAELNMQGGSVFSNTALNSAGSGGGIRSGGNMTLDNVLLSQNAALGGGGGGAISANAPFTVSNSTFTHNHADNSGGAIFLGGSSALGLLSHVTMLANDSNFGGAVAGYGTYTVTAGSHINGNTAIRGGALNIFGGGGARVTGGSQLVNNQVAGGGPGDARGAGIINAGQLTLQDASLDGNFDLNGAGAGLYNDTSGQASLSSADVVGNQAQAGAGGGIANLGVLTITASAIFSNTSLGDGAAISNTGTLSLLNTTLGANNAGGAGALLNNGQAALNFVTVADNTAVAGGGLVTTGTVTATLTLANSLLSGNTGSGAPNCSRTVTSLGYNLIADTNGCTLAGPGTGDRLNVDPKLTALIDQGGVLRYYDVLAHSPVLNHADPAGANCPATDQRGAARPIGPRCDIGAIESSALAFYYLFLPVARR